MKRLLTAFVLGLLLVGGRPGYGNDRREVAFGSLETMSRADARDKASAWLGSIGKTDAATKDRFNAIWKQEDRTVLDLVAETLALGNPDAAKLLAEVRDPNSPAPIKVPDILKDTKQALFFRANLGLAYARYLSNRRIHEEALAVLKVFRPEQVVDPDRLSVPPFGGRACPFEQERGHIDDYPAARRRYRFAGALQDAVGADASGHPDLEGQGPGLHRAQDGKHRTPPRPVARRSAYPEAAKGSGGPAR